MKKIYLVTKKLTNTNTISLLVKGNNKDEVFKVLKKIEKDHCLSKLINLDKPWLIKETFYPSRAISGLYLEV